MCIRRFIKYEYVLFEPATLATNRLSRIRINTQRDYSTMVE